MAARGPLNIAIFLFDGAEELDWAGPWEVLSAWARRWPDDGVTAFTVAESTDRPVTCAKGLRVLADHAWADAPPVDVLLVPGGDTRAVSADERVLARVRGLASADKLVTSVCTGAFVLEAAGLLEGRPATTHWGSIDGLRDLGVDVRPDDRFVDAGAVVTAAGVSAGIDMALHLVARLHSRERAQEVRRYIQYDPEPPV